MTLLGVILSTYTISVDSFQLNWSNVLLSLTFESLSDIIMMNKVVLGVNFKHGFYVNHLLFLLVSMFII